MTTEPLKCFIRRSGILKLQENGEIFEYNSLCSFKEKHVTLYDL